MTDYKFTYFNVTAKGHTSRLLFALAGVKFQDIRIEGSRSEEWLKLKPKTPFGQVPILEVDGKTIAQSRSIERFIAKRFGLYGANAMEQAKADMIVDCLDDMAKPIYGVVFADEKEKPALKKKYEEEQVPKHLENLENLVDPSGWFVGEKISWPDVAFFQTVNFAKSGGGIDLSKAMTKTPKVKTILANVEKNPNIAAWLKNSPKTRF